VEVMARRNYMARNTPLLIGVSLFCCVSMPLDFEKSAGKVPPTQAELNNLLQFQPGDDWLSLVKKLRP
jgi:hypothetical protein